MARVLSDEATASERDELQHALQHNPALQQQYDLLQQLWTPSHYSHPSHSRVDKVLRKARIREQHQQDTANNSVPVRRLWPRRWMVGVAASLLIVISATIYIWSRPAESVQLAGAVTFTDSITTQNGNRSHLVLPDGSRVWLNAGSRLFYKKNFDGKIREVQLIGEAFFDVVRMPEKPFIVHAYGVNIRVLGTMFNVKCYPGDENVETTLLHGSVAVSQPGDPDKRTILLSPNEKLSIRKEVAVIADQQVAASPYSIRQIDTTVKPAYLPETSWVYNRLEFKGDDFVSLAEKMERWYNVRFQFKDERVKQLRFIGSFENETVEQALNALQLVANFSYQIHNNEISIRSSR